MKYKDKIVIREGWKFWVSIFCLLIAFASITMAFSINNNILVHNKICEENPSLAICEEVNDLLYFDSPQMRHKGSLVRGWVILLFAVIALIFSIGFLGLLYEFVFGEEYFILKKKNSNKCYLKKVRVDKGEYL